jgi:hypothetical protein
MKMEQTECSETLAFKLQTPGKKANDKMCMIEHLSLKYTQAKLTGRQSMKKIGKYISFKSRTEIFIQEKQVLRENYMEPI